MNKTEQIRKLASDGNRPEEIAQIMNMGISTVYLYARKNNIEWKYKHKEPQFITVAKERHKLIREYKAQGHTAKETAEHFGMGIDRVKELCRGVAPQSNARWEKDTDKRIAEHFREVPKLEYVGGYTHTERPVRVRCRNCGREFSVNFQYIRRRMARCKCERQRELEERREKKARELETIRAERKARREQERQDRKREAEERKAKRMIPHPCPVCGSGTIRKKYCSDRCASRQRNKNSEMARRDRMKTQMVDKDITIESVYKIDGGVCYICGLFCSWDDYEEHDGVFIAGNFYPSIEHVMPLSRGGLHSWNNVRLAHRKCNSHKGARIRKRYAAHVISGW